MTFSPWDKLYIFDSIKIAACRFDYNMASYGGAVSVSMPGDTTIGGSPEEGNLFESNFAPVGADLCSSGADVNATFNTFEGNCLSDYYVSHPYCFNLENCVSGTPLIYQDVYVSPQGDDTNDGLTMETAFRTIQHAMSRICADHGQYFTVFLDRGRYSPSATGEIYPLPCLPNISLKGSGMDETVLDAEQTGRVIHYSEDDNISIDDLTVSSGRALSGAGMYCFCRSTSNFSIRNCRFTDNTTDYAETCGGGGITVSGWRGPTISECVFTRNYGYTGGGLWTKTSYSTRIRDCDFTENAAYQGGGLALDDAGDTEVTRCSIMYNSAELGAGVACICGGTVRNCMISNNCAGNRGGGVYGDVPRYRESHGRLENCVISGNTADMGAGFHVNSLDCNSLFRIVNCTVYGNRAGTHGGGGAGDAIWFSDDDSPTIINSIIWENDPDGLWFGYTGETPAAISYSLTQDGNPGAGNLMLDPLFLDPGFRVFSVSGYSPCIDTGTDEDAPPDDLDGYDRPRGGAVDIGAYEYPGWPLTSRIYITMPSHTFSPGEMCSLNITVWNREMFDLVDYPLFVMLQMADEGFWLMGPSGTDSNIFTFPEGLSEWEIIPPFPWPNTSTTASGLVWYAAVTDPGVTHPVGNVGTFDFGWE